MLIKFTFTSRITEKSSSLHISNLFSPSFSALFSLLLPTSSSSWVMFELRSFRARYSSSKQFSLYFQLAHKIIVFYRSRSSHGTFNVLVLNFLISITQITSQRWTRNSMQDTFCSYALRLQLFTRDPEVCNRPLALILTHAHSWIIFTHLQHKSISHFSFHKYQ